MTKPTNTQTRRIWHVLGVIAEPILFFSGFLAFTLLMSLLFLLPRWGQVRIADTEFSPVALEQEYTRLTASITSLTAKRDESLQPLPDPIYLSLQEKKRSQAQVIPLIEDLRLIAQAAVAQEGVIVLQILSFDASKQALMVTGDVRDAGFSSVTVLAQFIDQLKKSAHVESLDPPVFERAQNADGSVHSPFHFTIHLK